MLKWKEGGQFENPPAGSHIARCVWVIDLGTQQHSYAGETWTARDVRIAWELPEMLMEGKYNDSVKGKPFMVSVTVKQSLHASAKLRGILESWRGKKFTKEELAVFKPSSIVGAACRVNLIANGDYMNVDSVSPLSKKEKCPKQVNPSIFLSLEQDEFDLEVFSDLPEKLQDKIRLSPEWKLLVSGPEDHGSPEPTAEELAAEGDVDPFRV